jgi:phosphatidate cytidylyltransferase
MMITTSSLFISPEWGFWNFIAYFLAIGVMLAIRKEDPEELFNRYASLIWGVAYIGLLYPVIYYIRNLSAESGGDWLLFLFGTLWLSDSLAMWVGKTMGQNKLAPMVSPNKTVEGFIGGIFGGLMVALILSFWRLADVPLFQLALIGIFISIVGQLGDLAESVWKRALRIKDSSTIIPGHGGVLDRFDSLLFAAPILFWFLRFIIYG